MANAEMKALVKAKFGSLGDALEDTRLHPIPVRQEIVPAVFEVDPRAVALDEMCGSPPTCPARWPPPMPPCPTTTSPPSPS